VVRYATRSDFVPFLWTTTFFDAKSKLSVNLSVRERRWERLSSDATAAAAAAAAAAAMAS